MLMVIDCHAIGHRVKHAMADLSFNEKKTGIIFGFLSHILKYAEKFNTNSFVFAWDSRKSYRALAYSDYKVHNNKGEWTEEEVILNDIARAQFNELRNIVLPRLGFTNIFMQIGCEADDIIAIVVRDVKAHQAITDITVVSRDNDLFQLLDDCNMYDPQTKKLITADDLMQRYGVTPQEWVDVKSIAGCVSDNIGNVPGVREETAIKYLHGKLTHGTKYDAIVSRKGQNIIKRNVDLVKLPYPRTKKFMVNFDEMLYLDDFVAVFEDYGFQTFLHIEVLNKWRKFFRLRNERY